MFADQVYRVMWKEYRAQRSLWLGCLLIGFVAMLSVTGVSFYPGLNISPSGLWLPLVVLMHAIGCGAILFANERETGVSSWLVGLSIPAPSYLTGKLAFALVSSLLLQMALAALASSFDSTATREHLLHVFGVTLPITAYTLPWAILGSLLCGRVLLSVGIGVLCWLVVQVAPVALMTRSHVYSSEATMQYTWITTFAVVLMDVWLGWRWCRGKFAGASLFESVDNRVTSLRGTLTADWMRFERPRMLFDYTSARQRNWLRLVWYEKYRDPSYRTIGLLFCLTAVVAALLSDSRPVAKIIATAAYFATPILAGLLAFQHDDRLNSLRFFAERGVSPTSLWLAKQFVWLPRAFCMTFVIAIAFRFANPSLGNLFPRNEIDWTVMVWHGLLSYGCGQACALVIRQPLTAAIFAIAFSVAIPLRMAWLIHQGISITTTVIGPTLALFVFSLWQLRPEMYDDSSPGRKRKLIAIFVLTALASTVFGMQGVPALAKRALIWFSW